MRPDEKSPWHDPTLIPFEFKSWLARYIDRNPRIKVNDTQITGAGIGGGGTPVKANLVALWQGQALPSAGAGWVWIVPNVGGSSVTFNLNACNFVISNASTGTIAITVQKSVNSGASWTTVCSISLAGGSHNASATPVSITTTTGDLLRLNWTAIGSGGSVWTLELQGKQQ